MHIRSTIHIARSPEAVFPWIGDPEKALQWQESVAGGRVITRTEGMVGTTFEETVRDRSGSTTLHGVITKWIPDRLVAFQLDGAFNSVEVEFRLDPEDGGTRVTQSASIRFKSTARWLMLIAGGLFKARITRQMASEFRQLKALCETGAG